MELNSQILEKLEKIQEQQQEHTLQLALNNAILQEHHKRSTNLEARFLPVEDHVKFVRNLVRLVGVSLAGIAAVATVLGLLVKK